MTTAADLIERTLMHLLGNTRQEINLLVGDVVAGTGTLTFQYPLQSIQAGSNIEIDQEVFRVMSVSGQTASVIGAQVGSVSAGHDDGALVTVNPRFYRHSILNDLNATLSDLDSQGLFQEKTLDITYNSVYSAYNLATDVLRVLEVRYQEYGPSRRYPLISQWSLMRDMDTTVFASGTALSLNGQGGSQGLPLRVRYAAPFTPIVDVTDTLDDIGLPASAQDLPPMGAAIRQMLGRDIKRSFLEAQPDTRRAQEVPPGSSQNAMRSLQQAYYSGIADERGRQLQRFPYRMSV